MFYIALAITDVWMHIPDTQSQGSCPGQTCFSPSHQILKCPISALVSLREENKFSLMFGDRAFEGELFSSVTQRANIVM